MSNWHILVIYIFPLTPTSGASHGQQQCILVPPQCKRASGIHEILTVCLCSCFSFLLWKINSSVHKVSSVYYPKLHVTLWAAAMTAREEFLQSCGFPVKKKICHFSHCEIKLGNRLLQKKKERKKKMQPGITHSDFKLRGFLNWKWKCILPTALIIIHM